MKFKFWFLILSLLIFIGGCSQAPGVGTQNKEIISSDGLVASFSINKNFLPLIEYELILRNSGAVPVLISKDKLSLFTLEKMQSSSQKNVITQESIDDFFRQIFLDSSELILGPEQRRIIRGTLKLEDDFYLSSINNEVTIFLNMNYDYETKVSTNVNLNIQNRRLSNDVIVQAAPVIVENLDLLVIDSQNFRILFDIKNKGRASSVDIDSYEFFFGTNLLSCIPYGVDGEILQKDILSISKKYSHLTFSCVLPNYYLNEESALTTKFYGNFKYNYRLSFDDRFVLPKDRRSSFE